MQSKTPGQVKQFNAVEANRSLLIEQMEERVLFDAVPIAPVDAFVDADFILAQLDSTTQALTSEASIGDQVQREEQPKEIVFVDKSVEGFEEIVAEFVAQRDVEVFFVNDNSAGLEQIANHLKGRSGLNAIHIVSHGNDAHLNLGNSVVGTASLSGQYLSELVRIGRSLNENGDILLYGCDLASSANGEAFIKKFSQLTNADVAASDDITGAVSAGGDWDLEKQVGSIEAKTLSSDSFEGKLIVTDAGFTVGTAPNLGAGEVAVVPVGQPGSSSYQYNNAATAAGGAISIDVRLTLVNTFDELGNITNGTADQIPVTFGNWAGSPIVLSRVVGASVSGYEGHTAEILVEFFDSATGNPLSVVGDFTFQDIDFILAGPGRGTEAIRVNTDEMAAYSLSSTPATEIDVIDNGDGLTTFTNDSSSGGENDQQRWVTIQFYGTPSLTLFFDSRNSHTGYGLSTRNFSATPLSFAKPDATDDDFSTDQDTSLAGNVATSNNGNGIDSDPDGDPLSVALVNGSPANVGNPVAGSNGGQFVINNSGSFSFDPNGDFDYLATGESVLTTVTYEVRDVSGLADSATVRVVVTGTNDTPIPVGAVSNQFNNDGDFLAPFDVSEYFTDPDTNDTFSFSDGGTLPPGLSINSLTGIISGTIDNSASLTSPFAVVITANDGNGGTIAQTFLWTVTNPAPTATNNSGNVKEDTQLSNSGNVISDDDGSGVDADPDNDALFVSAVNGVAGNVGVGLSGTYGSIVINAAGAYTYTLDNSHPAVSGLDNGETLADSFTYTVSDGEGGSSTATITVTIAGTNDAPVVASTLPDQTGQDAATITPFSVASAFSDPDGDTLTYTAANLPTGLSINPATGQITGTVDNNASLSGPYFVTISAADENGGVVAQSFDWIITNPAPSAAANAGIVTEDGTLSDSGNVITDDDGFGFDTDPDGDTLTVTAVNGLGASVNVSTAGSYGSIVINSDGTYTYTLDNNNATVNALDDLETLTESFSYTISDGQGGISTANITITINGTNDDPEIVGSVPNQAGLDGETISILDLSSFFSDPDGDSLSFSAVGLPSGLSMAANGQITGTLDSSASQGGSGGVYNVSITATDDNGQSVTTTFIWTVTNPAPIANDDSFVTSEGVAISASVATNDIDSDGDSLTYTPVSGPTNGSVAFALDGTFTYTPNALFNGTDSFAYLVTDADGLTSSATVTITIFPVNDLPGVDTNVANQSNAESETISFDVSGNFSDPDGDILTFSATGLPGGLSIDTTGNITGTIDSSASASGPYTVVITANDGKGGTVTNTFTWTVTNPPPTASEDTFSTVEDTPLSGSVAGNDSDPDGDSLTFNQLTSPVNGSLIFDANGNFTYVPDANFNGTDSFDYAVVDADGAVSTATVHLTVDPANDPPVLDSPIPAQSNLDADVINEDISGAFSDPDGDTMTFTASGLPPGLSLDPFTGEIFGTIDSDASVAGTYTIVVTANDGNGGSISQTFIWTVANPIPIAQDDNFATAEDTPLFSSIAGNDFDPDGDVVTFSLISGPSSGTLTFNSDGTFSYTPDADFFGIDTFSYRAIDANGSTCSAGVTIEISPVNDAPTAFGDSMTTAEDTLVNINLLVNDADPENDSLTVTIINAPTNGIATVNSDGSIDYTPVKDFNGADEFEYEICDTGGLCTTATVTIAVTPVNDAPVVNDDIFTTLEDTTIMGSLATNDSDPEGDTLTYSFVTPPAQGTLTLNPDGTFIYAPEPDFNGTVTFSYRVTDRSGASDTGLATINVTAVNDSPVLSDDAESVNQDTVVTINLLGNDVDPDNDLLTITHINGVAVNPGDTVSLSSGATVTLLADGSVNYDPNGSFSALEDGSSAIDTFLYTVSDGNGGNATAETVVTVNGENDSPVAEDDYVKVTMDTTVTFRVLANDADPEGDPLAVILLNNPPGGTATVNPDGTISFVPDADFVGIVHLHYLVEDPGGASSEATLTIEFEPEFRFDSFTDFSRNRLPGRNLLPGSNLLPGNFSSLDSLPMRRIETKQIFSLAPEPNFSGYARPGTQIIGRIYDSSGAIIGERSVNADPGGNWLIQFPGSRGYQFYRVEFEQVAAVGSVDIYGYFGLSPADNSYQPLEDLTYYDKPLSVEVAMFDSFDDLQQLDLQTNMPVGFGRTEPDH